MALNALDFLKRHDERVAPALSNRLENTPVGEILAAQHELSQLEAGYDPTVIPADRSESLRKIALLKTRVYNLENEAERLETQIEMWSPGGAQYENQMHRINADKAVALGMLSSANDDERRRGEVRLQGDDAAVTTLNVQLARMRARLTALRG